MPPRLRKGPPSALTILLALPLSILMPPSVPSAAAAGLRLEAESFTTYGNIGGEAVHSDSCGGASAGVGVNGLDVPGEFVKVPLELPAGGCFSDSIRSAGGIGFVRSFALQIYRDDGVDLVFADSMQTPPGTANVG